MNVQIREKKRVCILDVAGRLTLRQGEGSLRRRLDVLIDEGKRLFVFNLSGLSVIDSAGVGEIVSCYQRAGERGAVLKIALAPDGLARRVFKHSGLEQALEVFDEEDEAIASFS